MSQNKVVVCKRHIICMDWEIPVGVVTLVPELWSTHSRTRNEWWMEGVVVVYRVSASSHEMK